MKTTLCDNCKFGLIREWDWDDRGVKEVTERHFSNWCLLARDYPGIIISCSHHKKANGKVTYHDPDFDKFEASMDEVEDRVKEKTLEVL